MNNIFDFRRFGLLLRKTIYEKGLVLGGTFVLLIAIMLFLYWQVKNINSSQVYQNLCFGIGFIYPAFLVSFLLNNFSKKSNAASYLALPCSHFEKWLSVFIIVVLIYLPLFLLTLKIIDTSFINHYREIAITKFHWDAKRIATSFPYIKYRFEDTEGQFPIDIFLSLSLILGSISILGSLYFNQKSLIKTAIVCLGFILFFSFLGGVVFELILGEKVSVSIFNLTKAVITNKYQTSFTLFAQKPVKYFVNYFILIFIPFALWAISLVRFREKEL